MSAKRPVSCRIFIYDGSARIGRVAEALGGKGFQAIGPADELIGVFPNRVDAAKAVADEHDRVSAERHRCIRSSRT